MKTPPFRCNMEGLQVPKQTSKQWNLQPLASASRMGGEPQVEMVDGDSPKCINNTGDHVSRLAHLKIHPIGKKENHLNHPPPWLCSKLFKTKLSGCHFGSGQVVVTDLFLPFLSRGQMAGESCWKSPNKNPLNSGLGVYRNYDNFAQIDPPKARGKKWNPSLFAQISEL